MPLQYLLVCFILSTTLFLSSLSGSLLSPTSQIRKNPGQQIFLGLEIGLPYDLANTLTNPVGLALTSVSVLAMAVMFFMSVLWVPYQMLTNRQKRDTDNTLHNLFHLGDGFRFLQEEDMSCRKRVVCDIHHFLGDCPRMVQSLVKILTRRLVLGAFKEATRKGLSGVQCDTVYKKCRKSNIEILSQVFPHIGAGKRRGRH